MRADGDGDGIIGLGDLDIWQEDLGITTLDVIAGDFNADGAVNNVDYDLWASADASADADGDGDVDQDDYDVWDANFGTVHASVMPAIENAGGATLEIPMMAPLITNFSVSASGGATHEYGGLVGWGEQLRSVPVAAVDTVSITFSEEVFVTQNALTITNLDGTSPATVTNFTYDVATQTASWTFANAFADGRTLLRLADTVYDLDRDALDGEFLGAWSLGDSLSAEFPTGNGEAGGEFRFRFTILENDVDRDNVDGATDYTEWHSYEPGMIRVSTNADELDSDLSLGDLSFREAIDLAETLTDPQTIIFDELLFAAGPATLLLGDENGNGVLDTGETASQLAIDSDLTVYGPGDHALTISGGDATRVFRTYAGNQVTLAGMTIAEGAASGKGGGVYNEADLTLSYVTIRDNQAGGTGGAAEDGGGLFSHGADLTINASNVLDNEGYSGGGVLFESGNTPHALRVENSTFAGNYSHSAGRGGALNIYHFGSTPAVATIANSTFSGNEANIAGSIGTVGTPVVNIYGSTITENHARQSVGGAFNNDNSSSGADITLHYNIIAGNTAAGWVGSWDLDGPINAASSYNLIGHANGTGLQHGVNGNQLVGGADPGLADLADNGGPGETHALESGSLALAVGDLAFAELLGLDTSLRDSGDGQHIHLGAFALAADDYFGAIA